ncbi:MAG: hypothetical protein GAK45_00542 [Pseudomonas citronellolis]|nr:MAG: hypothetical protein GAK45_00542 [Pseudomonas citronellolis]
MEAVEQRQPGFGQQRLHVAGQRLLGGAGEEALAQVGKVGGEAADDGLAQGCRRVERRAQQKAQRGVLAVARLQGFGIGPGSLLGRGLGEVAGHVVVLGLQGQRQDRRVERVLAGEMGIERGFADAGIAGDVVERGGVVALLGELLQSQPGDALGGGAQGGGHGLSFVRPGSVSGAAGVLSR